MMKIQIIEILYAILMINILILMKIIILLNFQVGLKRVLTYNLINLFIQKFVAEKNAHLGTTPRIIDAVLAKQ